MINVQKKRKCNSKTPIGGVRVPQIIKYRNMPILRSKAKVSGDSKVQYKAKEILTFKFNATEPEI